MRRNPCVVCMAHIQHRQQRHCASAADTAVSIEPRHPKRDRGYSRTSAMPSSGKSRRHRKNRPLDSKNNKQQKNGANGAGNSNACATNPTSQQPEGPLSHPAALNFQDEVAPPLPADAMEVTTSPISDIDDPAFNAFNYWKTPFPDVCVDVLME